MPSSPPSSETPVVMDATFKASLSHTLDVTVPGAHVQLRPSDGHDRVEIRGFAPHCPPEQAQEVFERRSIATHQSEERIFVFENGLSSDAEGWRWRRTCSAPVHLDLRLPSSLPVEIQTPGGTVDVAGLTGPLQLGLAGGALQAENLEGRLSVSGGGGFATVQNCSGKDVDLRWTSGTVTLDGIDAESMVVNTMASDTTLRDVASPLHVSVQGASLSLRDVKGPCEATVHGGALTYEGAPQAELSLTTVGGPLRALLPDAHGARVILTGPEISLDEGFRFEGERTSRRVEGTLNEGGPPLQLHAAQGGVHCAAQ